MSETLTPEFAEEAAGRSKGVLIAVGAIVLVAVAGLLVWTFVLGGEDDVFAPIPSARDAAPAATGDAAAAADDVVAVGETIEVFLARDPFQSIRPAPAPSDGDGGGGAPTGPAPAPDDPADPADPAPGDDGDTTPAPKDGDTTTVEGREVELIDVFEDNGVRHITVRVDDTLYTVAEGETFADNFRVLSIDPPCATMLYGDNQFTLCEGESIRK